MERRQFSNLSAAEQLDKFYTHKTSGLMWREDEGLKLTRGITNEIIMTRRLGEYLEEEVEKINTWVFPMLQDFTNHQRLIEQVILGRKYPKDPSFLMIE